MRNLLSCVVVVVGFLGNALAQEAAPVPQESTPAAVVDTAATPAESAPPASAPATESVAVDPTAQGQAPQAASTEPSVSEPSVLPPASVSEAPAGVAASAAPVGSKSAIERGGFYFGLGLGMGAATLSPEAIGGRSAALLSFRSGAAITNWLLVGAQLAWINQYNAWEAQKHSGSSLSSLMGEVMVFPVDWLPLNVSGGLGWGSGLSVERLADNGGSTRVVAASGNGVSWLGAVGWDFGAGKGTNFGLQARYDGASLGEELGVTHGGSLHLWANFY